MSPSIEGFVAVRDIGRQLDLHPNVLRRRLKIAGIPVFSDPRDRRVRLVRAEDAAMLTQPLPTSLSPIPDRQRKEAVDATAA